MYGIELVPLEKLPLWTASLSRLDIKSIYPLEELTASGLRIWRL